MKLLLLTLPLAPALFISCSTLNQPIDSSSGFDPLSPAGSQLVPNSGSSTVDASVDRYTPGQWVETSMANSMFFNKVPKGNASADKVLDAATPLKVVGARGTYLEVQLESGEVGFVPEIMVVERAALPDLPVVPLMDPALLGEPGEVSMPPFEDPSMVLPDPAGALDPVPEPEVPSLEEGEIPAPPEVPGISTEGAGDPEMTEPVAPEVPSLEESLPAPETPASEETAPEPEVPSLEEDPAAE